MHTMRTRVMVDGNVVDEYRTPFGIRTIEFDPDRGFFLNGKHLKLKGTNTHQDHAGVGCALPDELIRWRLLQLKNFGCNAYRSAHNPPTPELLRLCDEIGMLVINENRLMGTTEGALREVERLIRRDRNHPSVIAWSLGNEEWAIEGSDIGARVTATMQHHAKRLDPSRPVNVAISGGWGRGISTVVETMGFNYIAHGSTDEYHARFPDQPSIGTEEGSTFATRGIYFDDDEEHYKSAYDVKPRPGWFSIQEGWSHYADRDYLSGMFIWTGFDYRGEPTPYGWPSVTSCFGMMDLCGFPKDNVFYLKAWWRDEPLLHVLPHWNWEGREGEPIKVWVYSNCDEVELSLNGDSLGRQRMQRNGRLEWEVPYAPGTLKAVGFHRGQQVLERRRITAGPAREIELLSHKQKLNADNSDLAIITVRALDENGVPVPIADADIHFHIRGEGKIIGVGNGDPTSLEKDRYVDAYDILTLPELKRSELTPELIGEFLPELSPEGKTSLAELAASGAKAFTAYFTLSEPVTEETRLTWFYRQIGMNPRIYINGRLLPVETRQEDDLEIALSRSDVRPGENRILVIAEPLQPENEWDEPNRQPGSIQRITPAPEWRRKLFNGLAQVIVKTTHQGGDIWLKATSPGLCDAEIRLLSE